MVFGTFDVLHPGHEHFFRQAKALVRSFSRPFLIVSVARDKNVLRIKRQQPLHNERKRLKSIRQHKLVDKAVLGALGNHIPHIIRERPDIVALGYDQQDYVSGLALALKRHGLNVKIIRLKPHKADLYKSSIIKNRKKNLSRI